MKEHFLFMGKIKYDKDFAEMSSYKKFDEEVAFNEMVEILKNGLGRDLTESELRKIRWLSGWDYDIVTTFINLFKELQRKR